MLEVKNIVKSFGRNRVLNKISFKVNKGDIVSVIGPSQDLMHLLVHQTK